MKHKNNIKNYFKITSLIICIFSLFVTQVACATDNQSQAGEYITINPIADHFIGDKIAMNGSVNIFDAKQLSIRISPSWKGHPAIPRFDTKIDFAIATIDFQNNVWSYTLNTAGDWVPDEYVVEVTPAEPNTTLFVATRFNLSERTAKGTLQETPTQISPVSFIPTSFIATAPSKQPTTQKTPLGTMIPIIANGILFSFIIFNKK